MSGGQENENWLSSDVAWINWLRWSFGIGARSLGIRAVVEILCNATRYLRDPYETTRCRYCSCLLGSASTTRSVAVSRRFRNSPNTDHCRRPNALSLVPDIVNIQRWSHWYNQRSSRLATQGWPPSKHRKHRLGGAGGPVLKFVLQNGEIRPENFWIHSLSSWSLPNLFLCFQGLCAVHRG